MGKISPVTSKYIVHTNIEIDGVVDRPDVIGAIFGQTEGLLGNDLELRELQRSGRIGRIEVNTDTVGGKTKGKIIIPSSLDKAETCIIGASMEIIQRIGPCNARIKIESIEDVRVSKRSQVIDRAKELLKNMMDNTMPDSQELADEVAYSVRVMEIAEYGRDRLPAGPSIDESDEVIVVEGRADVLNLLKHGFKNAIAMNGTSVPETIIELSRKKVITLFVDGDRGGDLIIKELTSVADIDHVTKAPPGKEVEEITKKEIHKALRGRISAEQAKLEVGKSTDRIEGSVRQQFQDARRQQFQEVKRMPFRPAPVQAPPMPSAPIPQFRRPAGPVMNPNEKKVFKDNLENLIGTRGAVVIDEKLAILGKVPLSELVQTLGNLSNAHAVIMDGAVDESLISVAQKAKVKHIIGMENKMKGIVPGLNIMTVNDL